jgi:hypothetical protein
LLPFNRDVNLNHVQVNAIMYELKYCAKVSGFLLVAPEHRLSLQLKTIELQLFPKKCDESSFGVETKSDAIEDGYIVNKKRRLNDVGHYLKEKLFDDFKYIDVLDESDELLRHTYHLVYAVGEPLPLPGGSSRWCVVECLLLVISKSTNIKNILKKPKVSYFDDDEVMDNVQKIAKDEFFRMIRLLNGNEFETTKEELKKVLFTEFLQNDFYEFTWLSNPKYFKYRNDIMDFCFE